MKYIVIIIFILTFPIQSIGQGTSKFEIWGWDGTKNDFIKTYKDSTQTDLNYAYTCMADLKKMGYKHSISSIWVEDVQKYLSGNLNWDSTERLAIIRQIPPTKYSQLGLDSIKLHEIIEVIAILETLDTVSVANHLDKTKQDVSKLLLGTLSNDLTIRSQCNSLIGKCQNLSVSPNNFNAQILSEMLSFPDPKTTYSSIQIIGKGTFLESFNPQLFKYGAITIIDFLNSDLQTFKVDALKFLQSRRSDSNDLSTEEWTNWIKSLNNNGM